MSNSEIYQCTVCSVTCASEVDLMLHTASHKAPLQSINGLKTKQQQAIPGKCQHSTQGIISILQETDTQNPESLFQNFENNDQSPATFTQALIGDANQVDVKCRNSSVLHMDQQAAVGHSNICNSTSRVSNSGHMQQDDEKVQLKQQHQAITVTLIKCQICGLLLPSMKQYVNHLKMHQNDAAKLSEEQKYFNMTKPQDPSNHESGFIKCSICHTMFENISKYTNHLPLHATVPNNAKPQPKSNCNITSLKCLHCNVIFCSEVELTNHLKTNDLCRNMKIPQIKQSNNLKCGEIFLLEANLKAHITSEHESKNNLTCNVCSRSFRDRDTLQLHHYIQHTTESKFKCSICAKTFSCNSHLKDHMSTHSEERAFQCVHCEKTYKLEKHLKEHMIIHTDPDRFRCTFCGKAFTHSGNLKSHMASHSDERLFSCPRCQKSFKLKHQLNRHMIIHTDPDRFRCTFCGKAFTHSGNLKDHMASHSDERLFSCLLCQKSFKLKKQLNKHMIIHTDPDRFKCSVCLKSFSQSGHLKKHLASHSDERHLQCVKCQKTFKVKCGLNHHMKICKGVKTLTDNSHNYIKGIRFVKEVHGKYNSFKKENNLKHNKPLQCLMCLSWFNKFELENHMWECEVKIPCLNRIIEVKTEIKDEFQTDIIKGIPTKIKDESQGGIYVEIKTEHTEVKTEMEGIKIEIPEEIKTEIKEEIQVEMKTEKDEV